MSNIKYSMDTVIGILTDDQNNGIHIDGVKYLKDLSNRSGWLPKSLELMIETGMLEEGQKDDRNTADCNVSAYYERRELEDRDNSRSTSGYNSKGEMVELDFN